MNVTQEWNNQPPKPKTYPQTIKHRAKESPDNGVPLSGSLEFRNIIRGAEIEQKLSLTEIEVQNEHL
jgi:hypothetical protein